MPTATDSRRRGSLRNVLLSLAAVGTAASIAGLGTFATFTDSASGTHTIASGTVDINLADPALTTNTLSVGATNMAAGDTLQRAFNLVNAGSLDLASITLTTTASPSSLLDTDATNGLQMVVERCSVAWVQAGETFSCSGTTQTVLASRAIIGSNLALSNLTATTNGNTDSLRLTVTLPTTAGNTFQGLTSTVTYAFTATQRAATSL